MSITSLTRYHSRIGPCASHRLRSPPTAVISVSLMSPGTVTEFLRSVCTAVSFRRYTRSAQHSLPTARYRLDTLPAVFGNRSSPDCRARSTNCHDNAINRFAGTHPIRSIRIGTPDAITSPVPSCAWRSAVRWHRGLSREPAGCRAAPRQDEAPNH